MIRKCIALLFSFALSALLIVPVSAHPGDLDDDGGHYNRATGEYHYHHGYPEHQHTNGTCPYDFDDKTGENSGSSGDFQDRDSTDTDSPHMSSSDSPTLGDILYSALNKLLVIFVFVIFITYISLIIHISIADKKNNGLAPPPPKHSTLTEPHIGSAATDSSPEQPTRHLIDRDYTQYQRCVHSTHCSKHSTIVQIALLHNPQTGDFIFEHCPREGYGRGACPQCQKTILSLYRQGVYSPKPITNLPNIETPASLPLGSESLTSAPPIKRSPNPSADSLTPEPPPHPEPEPRPQKKSIPLHSTDSSAISHWGYDVYSQRLFLRMRDSGILYVYLDVPYEVAAELRHTPSVGRYYNTSIKGKYYSRNLGYKAVRDEPPRS